MGNDAKLATTPPDVDSFVARYPWPQSLRAMGLPLETLWSFEVSASAAELWPFVSDTSRLNRTMGVSPMEFEERDGRLHGRAVNAGFVQEWVEVPWTWVAERSMASTRLYSRGFAHAVRGIFELTPSGEGRTRLDVYFGWIPRGFWQRWLLRFGMGQLQEQFRRVIGEIERHIEVARPVPEALATSHADLPAEAVSRLGLMCRRLVEEGAEAHVVDRIRDQVIAGDDMELYRIQIRPLARRWQLDEHLLLEAFLRATRVGLFELSWDVICPHCRGVRAELKTLGEVPLRGDCQACGIDFETDTDNAIEITFRVHPSIRRVAQVFFCSAEPAHKSHIKLQQRLEAGQHIELVTALNDGHYRVRAREVGALGEIDVDANAESAELTWRASSLPGERSVTRCPTVILDNDSDEAVTFVVEQTGWSDDALRPSQLFSYQQFRDLFTEEYVGSDVQLSVGRQTILFTDVVGSTALYATRGDPGAFTDVKRHFVEIYQIVKQHRGAVVKTIGDAAMAAFASPSDALRAARDIQLRLPPGREDLKLRVRASINAGPCIAVNLNTNIDYFGNTVNVAAKLQSFAGAGQVAFPRALLQQPEVSELLEGQGDHLEELEYRTPGTNESFWVLRWDVSG